MPGHRGSSTGIKRVETFSARARQLILGPLTLRSMAIGVLAAAFVLRLLVSGVVWAVYPRIELAIYNDSSSAIRDLRVDYFYGNRTAEQIERGLHAVSDIQPYGSRSVSIAYRDSGGNLKQYEYWFSSAYSTSGDRGSLEVHITTDGIRAVDGVYTAFKIPFVPVFPVWPSGRMMIEQ